MQNRLYLREYTNSIATFTDWNLALIFPALLFDDNNVHRIVGHFVALLVGVPIGFTFHWTPNISLQLEIIERVKDEKVSFYKNG